MFDGPQQMIYGTWLGKHALSTSHGVLCIPNRVVCMKAAKNTFAHHYNMRDVGCGVWLFSLESRRMLVQPLRKVSCLRMANALRQLLVNSVAGAFDRKTRV